jgi:hypothetical protein
LRVTMIFLAIGRFNTNRPREESPNARVKPMSGFCATTRLAHYCGWGVLDGGISFTTL